jgi:GxxExxY protein
MMNWPTVDWGLTERVLAACIEVHRAVGPCLGRERYGECLAYALEAKGIPFRREVSIPLSYRAHEIDRYCVDFLVDDELLVDLRAGGTFDFVDEAKLRTCMRISQAPKALLVNFRVARLRGRALRRLSD